MTLDSSRLHLAIQKSGRLSQNTRELLRGAGYRPAQPRLLLRGIAAPARGNRTGLPEERQRPASKARGNRRAAQ